MTSKYRKHFTKKEAEYALRVAGKVPAKVIAEMIGRSDRAVHQFCQSRHVSLLVPLSRLRKYWPEYVPAQWRKS